MPVAITTLKAREFELSAGKIPPEFKFDIRPEFLYFWRRSILSGVQFGRAELPYVGEGEADSPLCVAAHPVLDSLADRLAGLDSGVLTNLEHLELCAILDALKQANGNKLVAANIVGVSRSTLYRKLNSYRIDPDACYF